MGRVMEAINLFVKGNSVLNDAIEHMISDNLVRHETLELNANNYLFREGDDIRQTFYVQKGLIKDIQRRYFFIKQEHY